MTPTTHALARPAVRHVPARDGAHTRQPPRRAPFQPARILVLDADRERQELLVDSVVRAGGEATVAHSGADALERLRAEDEHPPALLVAGLPDGSPRGFVAWARPRFTQLEIVALAADAGEAAELYNAGADIVMTTPLDPDLLGAKLGAALRRARRTHSAPAHSAP